MNVSRGSNSNVKKKERKKTKLIRILSIRGKSFSFFFFFTLPLRAWLAFGARLALASFWLKNTKKLMSVCAIPCPPFKSKARSCKPFLAYVIKLKKKKIGWYKTRATTQEIEILTLGVFAIITISLATQYFINTLYSYNILNNWRRTSQLH